jgi:CO dehydrogenase/acetyl-CoA synthase complex beta subunit
MPLWKSGAFTYRKANETKRRISQAIFLAGRSNNARAASFCLLFLGEEDDFIDMGLFDEIRGDLDSWLEAQGHKGAVRSHDHAASTWPLERSVVLKAETGLELGNPLQGSLSLLIWNEDRRDSSDKVIIIGPELEESQTPSMPLARLILVDGDFKDEYDTYRDLMAAIYEVALRGITSRSLPSRHEIWLRISKDALEQGLSLRSIGNALIEGLKKLQSVKAVRVIFLTGKEAILELSSIAEKANMILDALVKMYDEMNFDCESCEYIEVCDEVVELKNIRDRLRENN